MTLRLTKHHGLGNDFLVLIAASPPEGDLRALAIDLCERRRGIGADGFIFGRLPQGGEVGEGAVDLTMGLHNADGSRAEISGNGIRCLAQAEARRRGVDTCSLRIATDAGIRTVEVAPGSSPAAITASVDMGAARPGPEPDLDTTVEMGAAGDVAETLAIAPKEQVSIDLGNPHLVLLVEDPDKVDLSAAGSLHEATYRAGINVHIVAPTDGEVDAMTMRVWERGVGITEACGTGAVAVARAAHDWGLVGERVTVHMPGGDVQVVVGDPMVLVGPATFVADVEVDR